LVLLIEEIQRQLVGSLSHYLQYKVPYLAAGYLPSTV